MRIAHIILAHKNPNQLLRLINRINHRNADIYIHIDKKVDINEFKFLTSESQVYFISNRIKCNWGGNSLFLGILSSLKEVLSLNKNYDFINLLSAQDYPITSAQSIHNYLEKNKGKNFISFDTSKDSDWWKQATLRYEKHHFTDLNFKGKYFIQKLINRFYPTRKFPLEMELFGGSKSTWWTISAECANYVNDIFSKNTKLTHFLKYSWGTDEFAFATIVMNSPFKTHTINNNLRYIDWSEGNSHPKLLLLEDYDAIISSDMLFARKFDTSIDINILNKIDKNIMPEYQN